MEVSSIEINLLTRRISESIQDYFLSGIYSMEGGAIFRFNHSEKPERLVAVSSIAAWLTTKNLSLSEATKFVGRLRNRLERTEITTVEQIGNERIVKFSFETRKGERLNLFSEFFSHGNLVLTDPDSDETILEVENPEEFRHRSVVIGARYVLPPERGIALQQVSTEILISFLRISQSSEERKLSVARWLGRKIGTSRKFIEEIIQRAGIDPSISVQHINEDSVRTLASSCINLVQDVVDSKQGYILLPEEKSDLDPDVCPIVPSSWEDAARKKTASIISYPSLTDALDEVQIKELVLKTQRRASATIRAKSEELASAISKQKNLLVLHQETSAQLRALASQLMFSEDRSIEEKIVGKLMSLNLLESPLESPNRLRFTNEPRFFLDNFSPSSLASRLFDEAKQLEASNRRIAEIMNQLENQRALLLDQERTQEERTGRRIITDRRERQWYERYRWFVTSDNRLVVGGRDATSNSVVINKYMNESDIVFHADLHGSPFFILSNGGMKKGPTDELALEIAQATVSFSRAWKDELGSADAFWVFGNQIKKGAPSGEYLARGSFLIEGKKNFIRHLKVELSIGLTSEIPRDDKILRLYETDNYVVVCGPEKSIANYCVSRIKCVPGKEKTSEFARRAKQLLINPIKDQQSKDRAKRIPIDEIIRVLPSGGFKIVSEKR